MKRLFGWVGRRGGDGARSAVAAVVAGGLAATALATTAGAQEAGQRIGQSAPGQLNLQDPVTPVAHAIYDLHTLMLYIITAITLFVLALLVIVIVRYNQKANPKPESWTHNTQLEVAWTLAPIVILVIIAIPSVKLLRMQEDFSNVQPEITIKTTGYTWYWGYEYVDHGVAGLDETPFIFDAYMAGSNAVEMTDEIRAELAAIEYLPDVPNPERFWKLATDTAVVVPVDAVVLLEVTADPGGVIHSWALPSFGVKADAVPGKLNRTHFKVEEPGVYFGQCSELCGAGHAYMPIAVKAVSRPEYEAWVASAIEEYAEDRSFQLAQPERPASAF